MYEDQTETVLEWKLASYVTFWSLCLWINVKMIISGHLYDSADSEKQPIHLNTSSNMAHPNKCCNKSFYNTEFPFWIAIPVALCAAYRFNENCVYCKYIALIEKTSTCFVIFNYLWNITNHHWYLWKTYIRGASCCTRIYQINLYSIVPK